MRQIVGVPRRAALAFGFAALAVVGGAQCSDSAFTDATSGTPLVGTAWRLVSLEPGAPLVSVAPPDRLPALLFSRQPGPPRLRVGGTGPCNGFEGRYDATAAGTIRIDSLVSTYIGCPGERGALEIAYFARLSAATTWSARADSLLLTTADARWLLFAPQ